MYNFIFATTGVVIRGTFCKKSLFSVPSLLLFTAQFPQKFLFGLLFSAQFRKILLLPGRLLASTQFQEFSPGVVIHSTI